MLSQLIYSSRLAALDEGGIGGLLTHARERNAGRGLTGALLFDQNNFLQSLEGSRQAVTELFTTISQDPRHTDIELISVYDVDERSFPDWTMLFVGDTPPIRPLLHRFLSTNRFEPGTLSDRGAGLLIHSLVDLQTSVETMDRHTGHVQREDESRATPTAP